LAGTLDDGLSQAVLAVAGGVARDLDIDQALSDPGSLLSPRVGQDIFSVMIGVDSYAHAPVEI
jgi:hypothetical protein